MTQHFLSITDLNKEELKAVLKLSKAIEANPESFKDSLQNKVVLFCFEKPSFRTLVGTEAGLNKCGAKVIHSKAEAFLSGNIVHAGIDLGQREAIKDTIQIVNHYCDALFLRVHSHETLRKVQEYAKIPVVNALCDLHHPCQALADMLTIQEHFGNETLQITFVGDATNVAFSLAQISILFGHTFTWCGPSDYGFTEKQIKELDELSQGNEGQFKLETELIESVKEADVLLTDTYVSMGSESEKEERLKALMPYQINNSLWSNVKEECIFMHCLPAHRGEEVTEAIIDGPQSKIILEAKNRMITAQGLFHFLLNSN